jgi:phosphate transport system substrate-binding protein
MHRAVPISLALLLAACLAGCGRGGSTKDGKGGPAPGTVKIDGSSTVFPVSEAVAEEFQKHTNGKVRVTVGQSGTGGGFKKFTRGETDISDASRPILQVEMEAAKKNGIEYIELPVCFDALTVMVNPKNDWVDYLTVEELQKMWEPPAEKVITRWSQIRKGWPDEEIRLFSPGGDSGTFDYFTEAIIRQSKKLRRDCTFSEDDNVLIQGIAGNKGAVGYMGLAYLEANKDKVRAVPIQWEKNKVKEPVMPSTDSVLEGTYNPLSRPLFIYVNKKSCDRPEVKQFVEFYLKNGAKLATDVKYVPLPAKAYEMALERFNKMETGTAFGGHAEVGLPVEEILKRTPKH